MIQPAEFTRPSLEPDDPERLKARLQTILEARGLSKDTSLQSCINLALDLHENDQRTHEPYNNHLLRVTLRLVEMFKINDTNILTAAIMHDALEDHPFDLARKRPPEDALNEIAALEKDEQARKDEATRRELGNRALIGVAGAETVKYIQAVSNPIWDNQTSKYEQYHEHLRILINEGPIGAVLIKLADFIDNAIVPPGNPEHPSKRRKLDMKQLPVYQQFMQGLDRLRNTLDPATIEEIRQLLKDGEIQARTRLRGEPRNETQELAS